MVAIHRALGIGLIGCALFLGLLAAPAVQAHESGPEFIDSFDTTLEVREGGELAVTHVIDVHPHGEEIRRGVFFELPEDVGPLTGFSATLGGEPIELEFDDGAVILAAAEPLATHQSHRFVLRYRADAPWWRESSGMARLHWEPVIEQFELAWRDAVVRITWAERLGEPAWPAGGAVDGGTWTRTLRGPLHGEDADAAIGQLELRAQASAIAPEALRYYGTDWPWRLLLGAGILGLLGFLHTAWRAVGRDPDLGTIAARNAAPEGLSPAAARFVERMGFDETNFVAALVSLRVKQAVELTVDEDNDRLLLDKRPRPAANLSPGERAMMAALFDGEEHVEFGPGDKRAMKASSALKKTLGEEHRGRHFVTNASQRAWGIALGVMLLCFAVVAVVVQARDAITPDPWVIALGIAAAAAGLFAPLIYFELFKAPTRAGAEAKRQIAGLKRYFEKDRAPVSDARHFITLLPYAVALDCEEAWRDRFEGEDESGLDADTAEVLAWYREFQRRHEQIGAIIPIIAGATAANTAATASAGGASAGGV
jgi:hypothetical protein